MTLTASDRTERRTRRALRRQDAAAALFSELGGAFAGRYRPLEFLGAHGADGHVFRALDELLARDVVVKIFSIDPVGASEAPRGLEGARTLTTLDHPSLVTLYDAHLSPDGRGVLVTEYIDGPSLRRRLDEEGPLPPTLAAALVEDLARALVAVHEVGLVHHNLSSSNILLRPVRYPARRFVGVLADFGITHLLVGAAPSETPDDDDYLTPEQLRGDIPGAASDVYALGLLAVEALTGESPVLGGEAQHVVLAPLDFDPVIPSRFGYGWEVMLTAMTDPDPQRRPTAAEIVDLAAELRRGEAVPSADVVPDVEELEVGPQLAPPADVASDLGELEAGPLSAPPSDVAPDLGELEAGPLPAPNALAPSLDATVRHRRPPLWAWVMHAR